MEHARKMILVPEETIKLMQTQKTAQTPGTPLSRLDAELSEILHSGSFEDDRAKCLAYQQILQRYLGMNHPMRQMVQKPDTDIGAHKTKAPTPSDFADSWNQHKIIDNIPGKYRAEAKLFLQFITNAPRIKLNTDGTIAVDGKTIAGSHIVDVVNDAVRKRASFEAVGRRAISAALRSNAIPKEYIGNASFWRVGEVGTSDTSFTTEFGTPNTSAITSTPHKDRRSKKKRQKANKSRNQTGGSIGNHAQRWKRMHLD